MVHGDRFCQQYFAQETRWMTAQKGLGDALTTACLFADFGTSTIGASGNPVTHISSSPSIRRAGRGCNSFSLKMVA